MAEAAVSEPQGARLSDAEVAAYHRDGIVIPDYRISAAMLARMRTALDKLVRDNPQVPPDSMFCPHINHGGAQGLVGSAEWLEFASNPDILNMVGQVLGPDFLLWGTTVFGKPAGTGKEVPWHQDGEYWPIRPLATCSVWIAIDDATPENGCLRVIPGSHKDRRVRGHTQNDGDHLALNQVLNADEYREEDARDVVLQAGQISLHDVYLVHGSRPNRSTKRRAGYVLRFMPTTSHFDRDLGVELERRSGTIDFSGRALYLMRGRDVCGLNDFQIGHG